jgi:cell division septation protein DedD
MPSVPAIASTPQDITSLDRSEESATQALYRAVIGPINTDYYLSVFARFDAANRVGLSWNWAASLYTLNWMLFRQLKWAALAYVGAVLATALLLLGLGRMLLPATDEVQLGLLLVLALLAFVLPGLAGNALFYRQTRNMMTQALAATTNWNAACELVQKQASSRQHFIRLAWANITLALVAAALAAWFYLRETEATATAPSSNTDAPAVVASAPESTALPAAQPSSAASASAVGSSAAQPPLMATSAALAAPSAPVAASAPVSAPVPVPSASSPASASAPTPAAATTASATTASRAASSPATPASAAVAPVVRRKSSVKLSTEEHPFYINVGLFADDDNARRAYGKLRVAGLPALRQRIHTKNGPRTRVRVGPLASQTEAKADAEKIRALELEAMIVQP